MRVALGAALLAATAFAGAQETFSKLDHDGNGWLSSEELDREPAPGSGWIAIDRDQDGRITRREFEAVQAAPRDTARPQMPRAVDTLPRGSYSAQRLIASEVRDLDGERIGWVRDILLAPGGAVTALVVATADGETRVPWIRAQIQPLYVAIPAAGASVGATLGAGPVLPRGDEWRASELLDDVVQIQRGIRYAGVRDLIIAPWGEVRTVVVDAGLGSQPGLHAYPWSPEGDATAALRPFDYGDFDIVAPR